MNKNNIWMPFYYGDFLKDTMHLSTEEKGAYILMIMHFWQHGIIKNDRKMIKNITQISYKKMEKILPFFQEKNGYLSHERIEKEKSKALSYKEKQSSNGMAGAMARWSKKDGGGYGERHGDSNGERHGQSITRAFEGEGTYQEEGLVSSTLKGGVPQNQNDCEMEGNPFGGSHA